MEAILKYAFGVGPGIPNLSQAMPFNLGELMNLSATRSTDSSGNNVITGLADSMLANLANNNAPTVCIQAPQAPRPVTFTCAGLAADCGKLC